MADPALMRIGPNIVGHIRKRRATGMSSPYVFISYSRQDRNFVERLSGALKVAGVQTWIDVDNISAGANFQKEIEKGLLQAQVLLYVASRSGTTSNYFMVRELEAFMHGAGRVIPIIIDDEGPDALPLRIAGIQYADFRSDFDVAVQSLLKEIRSLQGPAPVAPAKAKSRGYVFISYAAEDATFVKDLKLYLKGRGYTYWDFQESERNYQVDYTLELEGVITNAEATLSVISPDWKKSPTTLQELHFSKDVHTPVFLLRVREPGPTFVLAGMTFIDFTGTRKEGFAKLDGEMQKVGL
jgi:hypothetical protein